MAGLEFRMDDEQMKEFSDAIIEEFQKKYPPRYIHFPKIAMFIEHGTGPARGRESTSVRRTDGGRSAKERIGTWVINRTRLGPRSISATKRSMMYMYNKIMETGTPPHPFIRPAYEKMFGNDGARFFKLMEEGKDMDDIMSELTIDIIDNLIYDSEHGVQHTFPGDPEPIAQYIFFDDQKGTDDETSNSMYLENNANATVEDVIQYWVQQDQDMLDRHNAALSRYYSDFERHKKHIEKALRKGQ